jgi:hypothetical protein
LVHSVRRPATFVLVLSLLLAGLVALAPAEGKRKGKPNLVVTNVSKPPDEVRAGETFRIKGKVRNRGKRAARRGRLKLELRGAGEQRRVGATRVNKRIKPKKSRKWRIDGRVPAALRPPVGESGGPYRIFACVKKRGAKGKWQCKRSGQITVPGPPDPTNYTPGSRSLNDPLFPQIGNGGYDVDNYAIDLDYDPATNRFAPGTSTTIVAKATQNLSQFSLDFQDLDVTAVTVDQEPAEFDQVEAQPQLSDDPEVTQPMKLVVTPQNGIKTGEEFEVDVAYQGEPVRVTDADTSWEGWIPACYPPNPGDDEVCDGAFVVNEPIGAQGWFPNNNYATDKATFVTRLSVPQTHKAFGVGELASRESNGDGSWTWTWIEDDPTATYLTTGTVGLFDPYEETTMFEGVSGRTLDIYNAIDASGSDPQKTLIQSRMALQPGMLNFLSERLGRYPFDSTGVIADRAAGVGYALEVQTKAHFAGAFSGSGPSVNVNTLLHEIAHQWMGNSVSPATWQEIWFNEGWAEVLTVYWDWQVNGSDSPAQFFDDIHSTPPDDSRWELAPGNLGGPENLFNGFTVYDRPGAMLAGYYEIVGETKFFALARALLNRYGYSTITGEQFVQAALDVSGLEGEDRDRLADYFQQWLFLEARPTLTPDDF